jgi:hypothetical protein
MKKLIQLTLAIAVSSFMNAQTDPYANHDAMHPSPEASALAKYAQVPVNLSTGIPSVDVPVASVNGYTLNLPISLSYHASGIRVDEYASWVGLGWALNAGGVITRRVMGLPDEKT